MVNIIDLDRVSRMQRFSRIASLAGIIILGGGLVLAFQRTESGDFLFWQTAALLGGFLLAQVGMFLAHRYVRDPRPDEVVTRAVRPAAQGARLYHYVLPVPHVLLTRSGPIILVAKYQRGEISVQNDKWRQKGIGMARFFGQQALGNPTREAHAQVRSLASFVRKHAPSVEEVPVGAIIIFTTEGLKTLDLQGSSVPAMHFSKVKRYLKRQGLGPPLPDEDYEALRRAFDAAAGDIVADEAA